MTANLTHKYLTAMAGLGRIVKASNEDIAEVSGKSAGAVGQHLNVLESRGVIRRSGSRRGRIIHVVEPARNIPEWIYEECVVEPSTVAERTCLTCRKPFKSTWVGHRRCNDCKGLQSYKDSSWAMI